MSGSMSVFLVAAVYRSYLSITFYARIYAVIAAAYVHRRVDVLGGSVVRSGYAETVHAAGIAVFLGAGAVRRRAHIYTAKAGQTAAVVFHDIKAACYLSHGRGVAGASRAAGQGKCGACKNGSSR